MTRKGHFFISKNQHHFEALTIDKIIYLDILHIYQSSTGKDGQHLQNKYECDTVYRISGNTLPIF